MQRLVLLLALALPSTALAVPLQLAHHGQLLDTATGTPITGSQNITFRLWDDETAGNAVWSEVRSVDAVEGHYSTLLNLDTAGRDALRDQPSLWLELEIGSQPLLPRQPVAAAPYALVADTAENVEGGTVNAQSVSVNNATVIDAAGQWVGAPGSIEWSALTGTPADADILGGLSCGDGSVAKWDQGSTQWMCATDLVLTSTQVLEMVDGAQVNLGSGSQIATVDIATVDDITWGNLGGVPAGFVDEVDDDTLASLPCADGDRAVWNGATADWECGPGPPLSASNFYRVFSSGVTEADAACTAGDVLTGGGCDPSGSGYVRWSYPSDDVWKCRTGPVASNYTVGAYAICLDLD